MDLIILNNHFVQVVKILSAMRHLLGMYDKALKKFILFIIILIRAVVSLITKKKKKKSCHKVEFPE